MKNLQIVAVATFLLAGCVTTGVQVAPQALDQFKVGQTTEADVVRALGKPTSVTNSQGLRWVSYVGAHAQARASSFIPVVGAFTGGADATSSIVMFKFGPDGLLQDITSSQSNNGMATGVAAGYEKMDTNQPRKVQ